MGNILIPPGITDTQVECEANADTYINLLLCKYSPAQIIGVALIIVSLIFLLAMVYYFTKKVSDI